MNKRLTAVVLMLALTLATLPLALPAQAAPDGPVPAGTAESAAVQLTIHAQSGSAEDPNEILFVDQKGLTGQPLTLQVANGTLWKDVSMKLLDTTQVNFTRKYLEPGKRDYRAVVYAADGTFAAVSNQVSLNRMPLPARPELVVGATDGTVTVKVLNGIAMDVKLYRVDSGRQLLWESSSTSKDPAYNIHVPIRVAQDGVVRVEAVGIKNGTQVASASHAFWGYAPEKMGLTTPHKPHDKLKVFTFTGDLEPGTQVSLQRHTGAAWAPVWTSKPLAAGQKNPTATYNFASEHTASFRAIQTKSGRTIATSGTLSVSFSRAETSVRSDVYGGLFYQAEGRVAANNSVTQMFYLDNAPADRTGYLQEYAGGKWVNLKALTFRKASGRAQGVPVSTPITQATVTRKYRVHVPETADKKSWTSATATIQHMNPLHYTGYKRTAYNYMKGYCPNQVINLIPGWTSYAYSLSHRIEMSTQLGTGKVMQYIALHECAHIREFKLYGNDFNTMQPRLNAIFGGTGTTGLERAADCMAYAMGADKAYGGSYLRDCSAAQMSAARKMLAGVRP